MKKIISVFLFVIIITSIYAKTDVVLTRTHIWPRLSLSGKISNQGFGYLLNFGSRYNLALSKEVNGTEMSNDSQEAWLQELWMGVSYKNKLSDNLTYTGKLIYRPRFFYVDNVGADAYTLQTFSNHNIFNYKFNKKYSLQYRLIFWDSLENTDASQNAEFYSRHLLGLGYNISKKIALNLKGEVILKHTVQEEDGEELLFVKYFYLGGVYKLNKKSGIKVFLINSIKNAINTDTMQKTVKDYYIELTYFYKLNF